MANEVRLIDASDAQEVKKALEMCYKQGLTSECDGCVYRGSNNICMDALMEDALALINSLESCIDSKSAVDAVPVVHGRWEKYAKYMICSECDIGFCYYKNETDRFRYCPNCGAKMDGDGNE